MKEIYMDSLSDEMTFIIETVGIEKFVNLCEYFQGESIYFPKLKSCELLARNKKIKEDYKNGKDINTICNLYNISPRQIKRILAEKSNTHM